MDIMTISLGLAISSFGTALFYASNLGSSPMATFSDGVHNVLNISYGTANTLVNVLMLIILIFIGKNYINIGTILCVFGIGPLVNFFMFLLRDFPIAESPMIVRYIFILIGTVTMGVGLGLYVAVERGYGPLEAIVKILCERKDVSYTKAKILQDLVLVVLGILLKAQWGGGTLIAALLTGPILQKSIHFFTPRYQSLYSTSSDLSHDKR